MKHENFEQVKKTFLKPFVHGFVVGWDKTRIGILLYSENTRYVAPMSTYTERSKMFERIETLRYTLQIAYTLRAKLKLFRILQIINSILLIAVY